MEMIDITPLSLETASQAFAALGSEQRLSVLHVLVSAGPDGISTGLLASRTGIPASTLTHHMRFLNQAGLVSQTRMGRTIICRADFDAVRRLSDYLILNCCADAAEGHRHSEHEANDK